MLTSIIILISVWLLSLVLVYYIAARKTSAEWNDKFKSHTLKAIKKAKDVEKKNKNLDPNEIWDAINDGGWVR